VPAKERIIPVRLRQFYFALLAVYAFALGGERAIASAPKDAALAAKPFAIDGPLPPEQAVASFALEPGLRIELVAAEPTIDSPVALAFDDLGRMFVAENCGYPAGPPPGAPPLGRIALLEDADGDGRFEKRTTFAEGLTFPNGVLPWQGGLIVTCAPDILYLKDTDNDGRADQRNVWLTGFSTKGSTQLRVSHPTLGIDGWIYVTSGLTGGEVTCPSHPERAPLKFGRTDFRFRPDLSQYETCDGGGQFGLTFDDFGHRFICYNRVQVQHVVLPSKYLRRNPYLAFSETVQDCPTDLAPEPLKGHGRGANLFPISANITTADSHAGTFTAACSVHVWRGSSLPERYQGGAFSCDPTGNLVHFDKLVPRGATYEAQRTTPGMEFLASRDNWCRPVFLAGGPDGALYICDMYRKTIEHPDYLPVEIRKRTDFESGRGMGRIWRVVDTRLSPDDLEKRREHKKASFDSQNPWQRDLAIRQRYETIAQHTAVDVHAELAKALADSQANPAAVAGLLAFAANFALPDELLIACLKHSTASIREQALRISEERLAKSPELARAALRLAQDEDPRVRFQWALSASELTGDPSTLSLASLAVRDAEDRWLRAAVLSSITGREEAFLSSLLGIPQVATPGLVDLDSEFGRLLGASRPPDRRADVLRQILGAESRFEAKAAVLAGFADALRARGAERTDGSVLVALVGDQSKDLQSLLSQARKIASDSTESPAARRTALALLAHADFRTAGETLLSLIHPAQPDSVQAAAIRALGAMTDASIAAALLSAERFPAYTPAVREDVLSAMLSGPQHLPGLLAAVESGVVPRGAIDTIRRKQLTEHKDPVIRDRAQQAFGVGTQTDRGKVYDEYKPLLALAPSSENGRAVFKKHCANCHRLDREGFAVGPDLFGIRNQPKEAILLHILVPEQEITQGFLAYVAETKDGRVLTGLVVSETPTSVTLKQALGKEETILRADLDRLVSSKLSLMPQEFEKSVSKQELADLISYLKGEQSGTGASK
jgi:putative membrane-bound dehydrogenase-like protein